MTAKHDIEGLADIKVLVDTFYDYVRQDRLLAPIFQEHLHNNWGPHLEKMYAFWNAALFGVRGYVGNPFARHASMLVSSEHFEQWLTLFNRAVANHFEGPVADDARRRAGIMAATFDRRIQEQQGTGRRTQV